MATTILIGNARDAHMGTEYPTAADQRGITSKSTRQRTSAQIVASATVTCNDAMQK
jgi:hypothetical protein